jgi:hypothetical protein
VKTVGNKTIYAVLSTVAFFFLSLLVFVSLLGENNKIDGIVNSYFKKVQAQDYFSEEQNLKSVADLNVFDSGGEFAENCFLLEFAMLEKYGLITSESYDIILKKDIFWIPYFRKASVNVSVSLSSSEQRNFWSFLKPDNKKEIIENLFTMKRINGVWRIASIHLKNSTLFPYFNRLKENLALESYVETAGEKLRILPLEVDTNNATIFEKRKLRYIFKKVNHLILTSENRSASSS